MNAQRSDIPDPDMEDIKREYEALRPEAEEVLTALRAEISRRLRTARLGATIKARVKTYQSYYFKRLRKTNQRKDGDPSRISDVLGLRIVCPFLEDLIKAETVLQESFEVIEVEQKGMNHSFNQFGYSSTHFLVAVPGHILESCGRETPAVCELSLIHI